MVWRTRVAMTLMPFFLKVRGEGVLAKEVQRRKRSLRESKVKRREDLERPSNVGQHAGWEWWKAGSQ